MTMEYTDLPANSETWSIIQFSNQFTKAVCRIEYSATKTNSNQLFIETNIVFPMTTVTKQQSTKMRSNKKNTLNWGHK